MQLREELLTMEIKGNLEVKDTKRNVSHSFSVPDGVTILRIDFDFDPYKGEGARYHNLLSLSLFDPNGFRGARHNCRDQNLEISESYASPGYIAGSIPCGEWEVVIDCHRVASSLNYVIAIDWESRNTDALETAASPNVTPKAALVSEEPGWYRGDLHGHTDHSDGHWSIDEFVAFAERFGLDFVTLTDHNTVSGNSLFKKRSTENLLTMGGMELTTFYGHALALGSDKWWDWRISEGRSMTGIAEEILSQGVLFVIAHPCSEGDPKCTGCNWTYQELMPGPAPAVEIWNGIWHINSNNEDALALYYRWLSEGHRLVATAGTDIHRHPPENREGAGFNVVYADELSEQAVMRAIWKGHLYLSSGPVLELTAQSGDTQYMMGDHVAVEKVELSVRWEACRADDSVIVNADGRNAEVRAADSGNNFKTMMTAEKWCNAEIRNSRGHVRAVTNPIFFRTD